MTGGAHLNGRPVLFSFNDRPYCGAQSLVSEWRSPRQAAHDDVKESVLIGISLVWQADGLGELHGEMVAEAWRRWSSSAPGVARLTGMRGLG